MSHDSTILRSAPSILADYAPPPIWRARFAIAARRTTARGIAGLITVCTIVSDELSANRVTERCDCAGLPIYDASCTSRGKESCTCPICTVPTRWTRCQRSVHHATDGCRIGDTSHRSTLNPELVTCKDCLRTLALPVPRPTSRAWTTCTYPVNHRCTCTVCKPGSIFTIHLRGTASSCPPHAYRWSDNAADITCGACIGYIRSRTLAGAA